jgi:hypothetical protein
MIHSYSSSDFILNYKDSIIAKSETNDCVVRSFASAFKVTYDEAHSFVKTKFNRQNRKGTARFVTIMNNMANHNQILWGKYLKKIGNGNIKNSMTYIDKGVTRNMTTFQFLKKYPKGTYMVTVRQHAFTIHNGVVIGNHEDALKTKKVILHAWEVLEKLG